MTDSDNIKVIKKQLYEKTLHKEWRFFHHNDHGQVNTVDKAEYYSWYDPKKVNTPLKWKLVFIMLML